MGVLRPLADSSDLMQREEARAPECLPQWETLKTEYSEAMTTVSVPRKGFAPDDVDLSLDQLLEPTRTLRERICEDMVVNERHLEDSKDVLLKCTALDPRYRLQWLNKHCPADEVERITDELVQEARALSPEVPGTRLLCFCFSVLFCTLGSVVQL